MQLSDYITFGSIILIMELCFYIGFEVSRAGDCYDITWSDSPISAPMCHMVK